jgi:hypothetical protein
MISPTTALGALYATISGLISTNKLAELATHIQQLVSANGANKYIVRMMLILVSYYEYYNKCNPCNVIQQLLQQPNIVQLLDINVNTYMYIE